MISAAVLTHNNEATIEHCLKSLHFCDEVVVMDDNSSDETVKKAKQQSAKVFTHSLESDFSAQRNRLLEKAKNEWVLFIDPDEEVTKELQQEIQQVLQQPKHTAYYIKRQDYMWGNPVIYGEVAEATQKGFVRLVKKGSGKWKGAVHEEFVSEATTGQLSNALLHTPHKSISDFIRKVNMYSTIRSKELHKKGHSSSVFEIMTYPCGKFLYTYFIKQGYKDGPVGFVYSFMMSFHSFLVRAKLYVAYRHAEIDSASRKA